MRKIVAGSCTASRRCILNGAAARTCQPGDQITICNSVYLDEAQIASLKPRIVTSLVHEVQQTISDKQLYRTSKSPAAPMPPPTHMVTTMYRTPRRLPSRRAWPTILAPDIP